jgi:flagellar hook-associated protein 1 FlgK
VRWETDNSVATVSSGKAGGQLTAINATIPAYAAQLDAVATQLRDEVNALHGSISGSIAVAAQDQSTAGNLQFRISLDGGAFTTVTLAGADWSGAGGAAALQAALQAAVDTAIGAANATATVTGGAGSALAVSIAGTAPHTLRVQALAGNTGFTTLLGTTAVGTDGIGGRSFFAGSDAASLALSADVAGNPGAVAAGAAALGPLDGSVALALADLADSPTGADASHRQMIVQLGVDTQTATSRSDIQTRATQSLDNARSAYSGVNMDEEMASMVQYQHMFEAGARLMRAMDSMLDTLINHTGVG